MSCRFYIFRCYILFEIFLKDFLVVVYNFKENGSYVIVLSEWICLYVVYNFIWYYGECEVLFRSVGWEYFFIIGDE